MFKMFNFVSNVTALKSYVQAVAALLLLTMASVFIALTHLITGKNPLEGLRGLEGLEEIKARDNLDRIITG